MHPDKLEVYWPLSWSYYLVGKIIEKNPLLVNICKQFILCKDS